MYAIRSYYGVAQDDHLVYLYSPELISAQAELLQAARAAILS